MVHGDMLDFKPLPGELNKLKKGLQAKEKAKKLLGTMDRGSTLLEYILLSSLAGGNVEDPAGPAEKEEFFNSDKEQVAPLLQEAYPLLEHFVRSYPDSKMLGVEFQELNDLIVMALMEKDEAIVLFKEGRELLSLAKSNLEKKHKLHAWIQLLKASDPLKNASLALGNHKESPRVLGAFNDLTSILEVEYCAEKWPLKKDDGSVILLLSILDELGKVIVKPILSSRWDEDIKDLSSLKEELQSLRPKLPESPWLDDIARRIGSRFAQMYRWKVLKTLDTFYHLDLMDVELKFDGVRSYLGLSKESGAPPEDIANLEDIILEFERSWEEKLPRLEKIKELITVRNEVFRSAGSNTSREEKLKSVLNLCLSSNPVNSYPCTECDLALKERDGEGKAIAVKGCDLHKDLVPMLNRAYQELQERYTTDPDVAAFIKKVYAMSWKKRLFQTYIRLGTEERERIDRIVDFYYDKYVNIPKKERVTLMTLDEWESAIFRLDGEIDELRNRV